MFETILFPTDGSDGASEAFGHVLDIADAFDASIHVVHVVDTTTSHIGRITKDIDLELEQDGERFVRSAAEQARNRGIATETEVLDGEPYRLIVEYGRDREVDLVAMPTHGRRGLERFLLGSTTERVLRRSDVPVLAIPPGRDPAQFPYENVLFPTDGSDCAAAALEVGIDVANTLDATLHVLSVVDVASLGVDMRSFTSVAPLDERATDAVRTAARRARDAGLESVSERVENGTTVHGTIRTYIEDHDVDVVVVGTHGRTGFDRYVLGSVTEKLVRSSPVPVLTVREPRETS